MDRLRPGRGRYVVNSKGEVAHAGSPGSEEHVVALPVPEGVAAVQDHVMGPTRVGEWLMVDVRVARAVPAASRIFEICSDLTERNHCGVVESTLVIDLLETSKDNRHYLLDRTNWPSPR